MKEKKSWREKLEKPAEPEIIDQVPPNSPKAFGTGSMVIVTPKLVDDLVQQIPKGSITTITKLREKFAADFGTDTTCPLTTGIFLRISAETAEEDKAKGKEGFTPYWRVIRDNGTMIEKFPGGIEQQAEYLKKEGFDILVTGRKGNKLIVNDFKEKMYKF
jgi:alkylated DNA nucleotide flippase Atl1